MTAHDVDTHLGEFDLTSLNVEEKQSLVTYFHLNDSCVSLNKHALCQLKVCYTFQTLSFLLTPEQYSCLNFRMEDLSSSQTNATLRTALRLQLTSRKSCLVWETSFTQIVAKTITKPWKKSLAQVCIDFMYCEPCTYRMRSYMAFHNYISGLYNIVINCSTLKNNKIHMYTN